MFWLCTQSIAPSIVPRSRKVGVFVIRNGLLAFSFGAFFLPLFFPFSRTAETFVALFVPPYCGLFHSLSRCLFWIGENARTIPVPRFLCVSSCHGLQCIPGAHMADRLVRFFGLDHGVTLAFPLHLVPSYKPTEVLEFVCQRRFADSALVWLLRSFVFRFISHVIACQVGCDGLCSMCVFGVTSCSVSVGRNPAGITSVLSVARPGVCRFLPTP